MYTLDPKKVIISFLGNIITGFADGEFITVERDADAFTKYVGADGQVARARNNNKSATVTITLAQGSPSNAVLSAAARLDELAGTGVGEFLMKDLGGATMWRAPNSWIRKLPATPMGKEIGTRQWVIDLDSAEGDIG